MPHRLDGLFDFEVMRRLFGDDEAERALLVQYELVECGGGAADVVHHDLDV